MNKIKVALYITMTTLSLTSNATFAQSLWQVSYFYTLSEGENLSRHQGSRAFSGSLGISNTGASNGGEKVNKINHFASESLSNTQRLKEILPLSSWSYLFPKSAISYEAFISMAAKRPQFCGSIIQNVSDKHASHKKASHQGASDIGASNIGAAHKGISQVVDYSDVANQFCRAQLAKALAQLSTMTTANDVSLEIEPWRQGLMLADTHLCQMGEGGAGFSQSCIQALPKVVDKALLEAHDRFDGRQLESFAEHYDLFAGFLQVQRK